MGEHPSADDVFHRLVDSIYESAMDVAAMPEALDLFSRYTCTGSPRYLIWDKLAGQTRLGVTPNGCYTSIGTMPDSMRALPGHFATADAVPASVAMASGADTQLLTKPIAAGSGLYDCTGLARGVRLFDTSEVCVLMSATPAAAKTSCPPTTASAVWRR